MGFDSDEWVKRWEGKLKRGLGGPLKKVNGREGKAWLGGVRLMVDDCIQCTSFTSSSPHTTIDNCN